jgi:hypothetical protein
VSRSRCESCLVKQTATELWVWWRWPSPLVPPGRHCTCIPRTRAFYVLAGQLSLQVGEEVVTGGPGTWACAPKDVPHMLGNFGTDEGRLLCMFAPGGFERRFERMLAKQHGDAVLAELSEAERATRLIGPPLVSPAQPSRPDASEFSGGAS